jgi:hypothetical protein
VGMSAGEEFAYKTISIRPEADLNLNINFFLTDFIALYASLRPGIYLDQNLTNYAGEPYTDVTPLRDKIGLTGVVGLGFRFFLPTRDSLLVRF